MDRQGGPQADAPARALPPVGVLLPDGRTTGQPVQVLGRLVRRWQTGDGRWIYRVAIRGWTSRAASTGQDLVEDWIELEVPDTHVRRVPGVSYDEVPTLRASVSSPQTQPEAETRPGDGPEGWIGERLKAPVGDPAGRGPGVRLHAPGCWAIGGQTGGTLSTSDARFMVRTDPIATACDVCGADKALSDGE